MMQFPFALEFGDTRILIHSISEVLAFFLGFRYYLYLRKRNTDTISSQNRIWIIIGAILGALAGSRLIGGLEDPAALFSAENWFMHIYSNRTVVGGFLGGLLGVEIVKKMIGEQRSSGDLFAYPMILGLIIGRIGCFANGIYEDTYGVSTTLFTGMDLGDGILRHPVTLYEIAFLIILWICLAQLKKNYSLESGGMFKIFMIAYLAFRFLLDFIKPHYPVIAGLSTIQLTCLAGLIYYYRYIINPGNLKKKTSPSFI